VTQLRALARRLREERGYSLPELITTMAIMGVVIGGLTTAFVAGSHAELDTNTRFQAEQAARAALTKLRFDVHEVGCATITNAGATVQLAPTVSNACTGTTPTMTWCAVTSPTVTGRYALYRWTGSSCSASAAKLVADYLTTNAVFSFTSASTGLLQKLSVDLRVNANATATAGTYFLKDDLVMRNSVRSP
jgi:prepilin-type N-terminal cleavage/methylation domain-containing protein